MGPGEFGGRQRDFFRRVLDWEGPDLEAANSFHNARHDLHAKDAKGAKERRLPAETNFRKGNNFRVTPAWPFADFASFA